MHMKLAYAFKHWLPTASVNGRLHDISNTQYIVFAAIFRSLKLINAKTGL